MTENAIQPGSWHPVTELAPAYRLLWIWDGESQEPVIGLLKPDPSDSGTSAFFVLYLAMGIIIIFGRKISRPAAWMEIPLPERPSWA